MSLQKQQDFLARLFTDEGLRQNFFIEPEKIGAENGLSETETEDLKAVLPEELGFFADTLFWKRLREVEKLLPLTKKVSGEDFAKLFREFSQDFNPQTVKKHFEDALEFCRFLRKRNSTELARNAAKFEQSKLEFYGGGKRFVICKLDFDLSKILHPDAVISGFNFERKLKIAVWWKIGKKHRHFLI
ncbi:MAG TPA: hypothetical protein VNB22_15230 [Pyrinomonadaceae bacterium]|nr:hypothetical protein [Pyrinomonadaceae bacterium]